MVLTFSRNVWARAAERAASTVTLDSAARPRGSSNVSITPSSRAKGIGLTRWQAKWAAAIPRINDNPSSAPPCPLAIRSVGEEDPFDRIELSRALQDRQAIAVGAQVIGN